MQQVDWILAGGIFLNFLLLVITLHQIKKANKHTKELVKMTERLLAQTESVVEAEPVEQRLEKQEVNPMVLEKPEALINAVLEEVFP